MKVKNKQLFLILFLSGIIGLLGLSLYLSPSKLFFNFANGSVKINSSPFNKNITEEGFDGYFNDLQKYIDVEHYILKFELLPEEEILKGNVTIKGKLLKSLNKIHLNFYDNLDIENILLNGEIADYKNVGTDLIISKKDEKENFEVNVKYSGTPVDLGFGSFVFGEFEDRSVVYTLSEPNFASTWFPCNDLPTDKALADIYITNDSSKVSVSNGYLVESKSNGSKKTYHWKTVYPISTYLISLNSADYKIYSEDYKSITGDSFKITYYTFPEDYEKALVDFEDHHDYMKFMEETFGAYPFVKEKYGVAEFLWSSGAMEHQTITGMSYRYYTGEKYYSDILIHELAHQWWGNAVGPATWKDVWLNEGFAKYSEALYFENRQGKFALNSTMQMLYGDFNNGTLYDPGSLFGSKVYNKGAWILHMLRKEVGDSNFFEILKKYYQKFKYKNASTKDFKEVCENVSGKDLDYFFDQWLYNGSGIIVLRYNWGTAENNKTKLHLWQIQNGFNNYHFPLEVVIKTDEDEENKNFYISSRDTTFFINTNSKPINLELDPDGWLLAHIWEEKE